MDSPAAQNDSSTQNSAPNQHHDSNSHTEKFADPEQPASPATPPPPPPSPPPQQPPAHPDGGLIAWLHVAAGFAIFFNTWGMLSTFPVFQAYYESGDLFASHVSSSDISWIGSIQAFLLQLTGLVAGPLYDRGHLRALLAAGGFLVVFGLMMLSLCRAYWQALLAQAFCIGIGGGLLFVPTVSLIPTWFGPRRIGLALGIAVSGSSLGGVVYPIVLSRLIDRVGFPWAVRAVGFIALALLALPLAVCRIRVRAAKPRAVVDWSAFTDPPFMVFTLALFLVMIGQTVMIFYVSFYPENRGYTDTSLAFYVAAIFNAGSTLGRILPNALSDRIGVFNTMAPLTLVFGLVVFCMLAVSDAAGMVVMAVVTGFFSGVVIALPPLCFRLLTENKAMIGTRTGQGFAIGGLGLLLAGPSAGAILGTAEPRDWTGLWVYGGVTLCVGALILIGLRVARSGFAVMVKC